MTSFMIRDILNLNSPETEHSVSPAFQSERTKISSPDQRRSHSVSTICAREITHLSYDATHLSQEVSRNPGEACSVTEKTTRSRSPISTESDNPGIIQNSWSRNKMKVRTVFTDIQRLVDVDTNPILIASVYKLIGHFR